MKERPKEKDIMYQLMNYEQNRALLEHIPHIRYLDMAIVFYYWKEEGVAPERVCLVSNENMRQWGYTPEELEKIAAYNTPRKQPVSFRTMEEMICELVGADGLCQREGRESVIPMHILTNKQKLFGAATILYPQVLWAISQSLQEDIYVLPSSIHEVIIVPVSVKCSRKELEEIVEDINFTQVPTWEVLSNHVFQYHKKEDFLGL